MVDNRCFSQEDGKTSLESINDTEGVIETCVESGFALIDMVKSLNRGFGLLLIIASISTFIGTVGSVFGTLTVFFNLNSDVTNETHLLTGVYLFLSINNFVRLFGLFNSGQSLSDAFHSLEFGLKSLKYQEGRVSERLERRVDGLVDLVSYHKVMRPLSALDLNRRGFMEVLGVMVTMLIVMLQFRIGE